jgi:hypothetical protein
MVVLTPDCSIQRPSAVPRVVPPMNRSSAGIGPSSAIFSTPFGLPSAAGSGSGPIATSSRRASTLRCSIIAGSLVTPKKEPSTAPAPRKNARPTRM